MSQISRIFQVVKTSSNLSLCGRASFFSINRMYSGDELGRGSGKGGGSGGSIRDAGGAFGKMEAAREEEYFRKLQNKQIREMKNVLDNEVEHLELENKRHEEAIRRNKSRISELHDKLSPSSSSSSDDEK